MSDPTLDPVAAAIERGGATARLLVAHRDALIHHLAAIILIAGPNGMVACAYGAAEAVRIAHERRTRREAALNPSNSPPET